SRIIPMLLDRIASQDLSMCLKRRKRKKIKADLDTTIKISENKTIPNHRKIMVKNVFYFCLLLTFISCSTEALYDKQYSFADAVWKINEPAVFTYKNNNPEEKVDIAVLIHTSVDYKYANMFV